MTVRWSVTPVDAKAWQITIGLLISRALEEVARPFGQAANQAYARTRFAGTFQIRPAIVIREITLFSTNDLIEVVEEPTRPHAIQARTPAGLHFYWQRRGKWVRTLVVHHPGTTGKKYIAVLFQEASAHLGDVLTRMGDDLNRGL